MKICYVFALTSLIACASTGGSSAAPRIDRNIITETEIQSVPSSSLYDLIEKLRPNFLSSRGATSINAAGDSESAAGYLAGRSYGGHHTLRWRVRTPV